MHSLLLVTHSLVRYFVLILLIIVIVRSCIGWIKKSPYNTLDNQLSLSLFIFTHVQLLVGLVLFFVSPLVVFSGATMKDPNARYWLVEHNTGMLIAIVLITIARISSKKMADGVAKHRRMFIFNFTALAIVLLIIGYSKRGFLGITY